MLSIFARGAMGLGLLAMGSCVYVTGTGVHTLTCTRASGVCVLERETRLASTVRLPLGDLRGAELEDYRTTHPNAPGNRNSKSARLVLLTRGGPVPFMDYYSGVGMDEMAAQEAEIEAFLKEPGRPGLHIRRDDRLLAAVLGGIPFLLGLGALASAAATYRRWREE